jgi:uncharacterized protein (DUF1810 family)
LSGTRTAFSAAAARRHTAAPPLAQTAMPAREDPFELERFLDAQAGGVFEQALRELRNARKHGHWMWFIFPQLRGLGSSELAQRYGIGSLAEAKAYLAHPVLGARLEQCAATLLGTGQRDPDAALGEIDAIKLRSSMTLFEAAARADQLYAEVLERFYGGARDPRTLEMLSARNRDPS